MQQQGFAIQTVSVPEERCLGDVLNHALAAAQGSLIAKFDDDDLYGADHLWDLVLASEYSGAALVGKVSEYVYLAGADCTIRRFAGFAERYIDPEKSSVAGGDNARPPRDARSGRRMAGVERGRGQSARQRHCRSWRRRVPHARPWLPVDSSR